MLLYEAAAVGFAFRLPRAHVAGEAPFTIAAMDLDRDGTPDVATVEFFGNLTVERNELLCRRRAVRR
ncbi:MAG: hypothetical protein ACXW5U_07150 [Thermoanaerobaculia bacterium]